MESQENTKEENPRRVGAAAMEYTGANTMVEGR